MLELFFKYPKVVSRLRGGGLGGEMDRIAAYLAEFYYKRASAKIYLGRLGKFSAFVSRSSRTMPIHQAVIDRFVGDHPTEASRIAARTAVELACVFRWIVNAESGRS